MLVIPYLLPKHFIILYFIANCVWSEETIYVSRFSGSDSTTCGKQSWPCRTISHAIHQVSDGSNIYLDGRNTSKDPYICQPLNPGYPGIYLTKSISFVGTVSRPHISCLHSNQWMVDGTKQKDGIKVNFYGLTFQDTFLHFVDALVNINNSSFEDSRNVTMTFRVFSLARFYLSLTNVVFERNVVCMLIKSNIRAKIFINMVNTSFIQNGKNNLSASDQPSILSLESKRNDINIRLGNCSFDNNTFQGYSMISVRNTGGTIKLLLHQFKFEQNAGPSSGQGIFSLLSAKVIMTLKFGFIYSTFGTFVTVHSNLSETVIFNIEFHKFRSSYMRGGAFDINGNSGFLSIKHSSFRNGGSILNGGVVAITAPNLLLTIHNCTFYNISASHQGGAVYVKSHNVLKRRNTNKVNEFVVELNIINTTFSNCISALGGAIVASLPKVVATITDSLFVRNKAYLAGAVGFLIYNSATVRLRNVNFIENSARQAGILVVRTMSKELNFTFTTNNVSFVENNVFTKKQLLSGILTLVMESKILSIVFKSTYMISNFGQIASSAILVFQKRFTTSNFVILDTCVLRENYGQVSTFTYLFAPTELYSDIPCADSYAFSVNMKGSRITIINSTFVNNSCRAVSLYMNKHYHVKIEHSVFERNHNINSAGSAIYIEAVPIKDNDLHKLAHVKRSRYLHEYNVLIKNVLFKENAAPFGGALLVGTAKTKLLNCTFINNFARSQGGQIATRSSASLTVCHCVFKQTIEKINIKKDIFIASSFLRIYSTGGFLLRNTTVDSKTISNEPLILVSRADWVNIDNSTTITCSLGSALKKSTYRYLESKNTSATFLDLSCNKCDYNFYSLQRGHAKGLHVDNSFKCIPCPRGADCVQMVISKPSFWGYNASLRPPTLVFTLCPFGYCKSPQANSSKYNDCQGKRTGFMCGSCLDGYTEALWSTYCTPVKDCNDYWFWILFLILALSMAVLLIFKPPLTTFSLKHLLWFKRSTTDEANLRQRRFYNANNSWSSDEENGLDNRQSCSREQLKHDKRQYSSFLEIVFYFYQIAQLLLSSYSLSEFFHSKILSPVLGFFNFEPSLHKRGFLCPFSGLTAKTKLAFKILPIIGTMIAIFTIYFFHVFINKLRGFRHPSVSSYLQASIKTVFLGYTTLATVGISLTRCVSVAGEDRWFYNGNVFCYQWWQYVSFAFNGIFVIPLIFVLAWASYKVNHNTITVKQFLLAIAFPLPFLLLWLFRVVCPCDSVNVEESENFRAIKEMLLSPYKEPGYESCKHGAIYWQSVLIARRFILVLIFSTVTEPCIRLFCMTLTCVFVLFFHLKVQPFRNSSANNLESLSLLLLVILGLINLLKSVFVGFDEIIKGPLVTVFKVFQWLEIAILGLFPALVSLLVCLAIISLIFRVLFICCWSLFKSILRRCAQGRLSQDTGSLANICEDING